jgi:hypothetical protein
MESRSFSRPRGWLAAASALVATLALAAPAAADPLGDQFRISDHPPAMGGGFVPDVAYNTTTGEHLVVWAGADAFEEFGGTVIYAQRTAADGSLVGDRIQVSDARGNVPAVAYNGDDNEWLVTWASSDERGVRGQRIAANGTEAGTNDFRIPDLNYSPDNADVAYSSAAREYMVGWVDSDQAWVHRVGPDGSDRSDDLPQHDTAGLFATDSEPGTASITYSPVAQQYMLVWHTQPETGTSHRQVYGQRIALDGSQVGDNIRVSNQDETAGTSRVAGATVVANTTNGDYLVTWRGEQTAGQDDGDWEVIGQRLAADGSELGGDFAVTTSLSPNKADLAYNPNANEYVALFQAVNAEDSLVAGFGPTMEVHGQRIAADGSFPARLFRLSDMAQGEDNGSAGLRPAVAYNSATCDYMGVWFGSRRSSEDPSDQVDQIWGRRVSAPACVPPPQPAAPAAPVQQAQPARPRVSVAGVRRACIRRTTAVRIRVALASGQRVRSVRVTLDGRRLTTSRRARFTVRVNPRRLRAGSHRLRIVATDTAGRRRIVNRTIRVCSAQRERRATPRFTG